jgi:hypothetical protein
MQKPRNQQVTQEPKELEESTYERRSPINGRTALAYIRVSVVGDRAKRGRLSRPPFNAPRSMGGAGRAESRSWTRSATSTARAVT